MKVQKKVVGFWLFLAVLSVLIITGSSLPTSESIKSFKLEWTPPDEIPFSSGFCYAKAQTWLISGGLKNDLGYIRADNSPFNIGHPQYQLSFSDPETNTDLSHFGHYLKMRCEIGFNISDQNLEVCSDPERSVECPATNVNDLLIQPSKMEVKIFAQYPDKQKDEVFNGMFDLKDDVVLSDGREKDLLFEAIDMNYVLSNMRNGSYDALIEVRTSGVVEMEIEDVFVNPGEAATFKYYLGELDIPTYFTLEIKDNTLGKDEGVDVDGDGIDDCDDTAQCVENQNTNDQQDEQQKQEDQTNKNTNNQNTTDNNEDPKLDRLIIDYTDCWLNFDLDCVGQSKFNLFNAIIVILIIIIIAAALNEKKKVQMVR